MIFAAVFAWSAINPKDYFTWTLEVAPEVVALALLAGTYARFQFTPLLYALILIHCVILMIGGALHIRGGATVRRTVWHGKK